MTERISWLRVPDEQEVPTEVREIWQVPRGKLGFVPNVPQSPEVRSGILLLAALGPGVLYAVGIALFLRFRLGEAEHAEIQRALRARAGTGRN